MIIHLDHTASVNQLPNGDVLVTRPSILGKVASHLIRSPYRADEIAIWLYARTQGRATLVQEAFPKMSAEDREFLISGITPEVWAATFPPEDDANELPEGEGR